MNLMTLLVRRIPLLFIKESLSISTSLSALPSLRVSSPLGGEGHAARAV
jgi:hypothetical protein